MAIMTIYRKMDIKRTDRSSYPQLVEEAMFNRYLIMIAATSTTAHNPFFRINWCKSHKWKFYKIKITNKKVSNLLKITHILWTLSHLRTNSQWTTLLNQIRNNDPMVEAFSGVDGIKTKAITLVKGEIDNSTMMKWNEWVITHLLSSIEIKYSLLKTISNLTFSWTSSCSLGLA